MGKIKLSGRAEGNSGYSLQPGQLNSVARGMLGEEHLGRETSKHKGPEVGLCDGNTDSQEGQWV